MFPLNLQHLDKTLNMKTRSLFILLFALAFSLGTKVSLAGVQLYYLKVCRDGRTLELRKENDRGQVTQKISFKYTETPEMLAKKLSASGLFQKRLWVYFHCMWGNNSLFHRFTLNYITEMVDNGQDNIVLSIIWPANKIGYKQNWKKVNAKGQRLGNFFTCIAQQQKAPVNVLSHSMGNRVFQGVWQAAGSQLKLENVILASADLDTDIFARDFKNLSAQTQRIIVVQHHNDRLLLASTIVHRRERLGRTKNVHTPPQNLMILDATPYASSRTVDMSNHLHFIFADSVRHQLKRIVR